MNKTLGVIAGLLVAFSVSVSAQSFDSSGNNLLIGYFFFRELIYNPAADGTLAGAVVFYGTITFNGNGGYTLNGVGADTSSGSGNYSTSGTYTISASGYGFLEHPYYNNSSLQVLVNKDKIIVGSSPDSFVNEVFIAVPAGSVNNSTFNGAYSIGYFTPTGVDYSTSYNTSGILNANGTGNIGNVPLKSYLGSQTAPITQTETGVSYTFSGNIGTLRFPTGGNPAIGGNRLFYISPDGNFIFGGTTINSSNSNVSPFDFLVGVRRGSSPAPAMSGLFYQTGLNQNPGGLDTYFGAFSVTNGIVLEHQRYLTGTATNAVNYTASGSAPTSPTTDYTDSLSLVDYVVSQDASIRIGTGQSPYLGLRVGVRTPDLSSYVPSGDGPFIHPMGVTNAASFAPFTSGISPGELINIFGSNFADQTTDVTGGIQFPTLLDGVQVLMNGRLAPLRFITPSQLAVVVPWETVEPVVQIQVLKNGVGSDTVTSFLYATGPGVFATDRDGVGPGAILHANYPYFTSVSPDAPALIGEVIQVFVAGLGAVSPGVPEGGIGGFDPLNQTQASISAFVDNLPAQVTFAGLAPGLAGLYQVNVRIPDGASTGDVFLDISTPDAYTSQATINVAPAASLRPALSSANRRVGPRR
jgi:uncharacterized protein (TIGR03437 family)